MVKNSTIKYDALKFFTNDIKRALIKIISERRMKNLPRGIRGIIYSYLDLTILINKTTKLSKLENKFIFNKNSLLN